MFEWLGKVDKFSDEIIERIGINKSNVGDFVRFGGLVLAIYVGYKIWKLTWGNKLEANSEE